MKKRKILPLTAAAVLTFAAAAALGGCAGGDQAEQAAAIEEEEDGEEQDDGEETTDSGAKTEESQENSDENDAEKKPQASQTLHPVTEENQASVYGDDNATQLCEGSSTVISIRDQGYDALKEALALYSNQRAVDLNQEMSDMKEMANEHFQSAPESFLGPYTLDYDVEILRADGQVFSFKEQITSYTGGAHGNSEIKTYTFDSQTGEQLQLGDVVSDLDGLYQYLIQDLGGREEKAGYFEGWEEMVRQAVYGETVDGYTFTLKWALGAEGLEVYFDPYEIGPWAMGAVTVTVPYQEAGAFLQEMWISSKEPNL